MSQTPTEHPQPSHAKKTRNYGKVTRHQIIKQMAAVGGVSQDKARAMLDVLEQAVVDAVKTDGHTGFSVLDLVKVQTVQMPERPGYSRSSPFTGAQMKIPPRPAYTKVRVRPLKRLKDAAEA